jgi:hypothetical protein
MTIVCKAPLDNIDWSGVIKPLNRLVAQGHTMPFFRTSETGAINGAPTVGD